MEHYCDRCGAQAKARWVKDEQDLVLCGHHNHEYEEKLSDTGFNIDLGYAYENEPSLLETVRS